MYISPKHSAVPQTHRSGRPRPESRRSLNGIPQQKARKKQASSEE